MRLTNVMITNTTLMHINRNKRNLHRIEQQIHSGRRVQRPSDDPIIASRALMFRTSVHETAQFMRNVDQGVAWMNVTESTFNNINSELMFEMRNLVVQGANGAENSLTEMQAIIGQMSSLFSQLGHEMNQSFGGNYLFSGFRTDEPPVFTASNNRSFVITQHFSLADISRESSFQRLYVEGSLSTAAVQMTEPVSHHINVLRLAFAGLDGPPVIPGFEVVEISVNDPNAYRPDAQSAGGIPILHFIPETGELVMHSDTASSFPREGVSVTYRKTGFRQGEINPMVYFTGREIITTSTAHIPPQTQLIYNITQYFSREASINLRDATGNPIPDPAGNLVFNLRFPPYAPNPAATDGRLGLPTNLQWSPLEFTVNVAPATGEGTVSIPARLFETGRNISITYAVELPNPPTLPDGTHIMEYTGVAGVELVRALADNGAGRAIPLDQIELNRSFDMHNQEIQYEFAARTLITVNSLAKNVLTDKMFADFRRFFQFADSLHISDERDLERHFGNAPDDNPPGLGYSPAAVREHVERQLARENAMARDALHNLFNNMLFLIDRHVDNSTREQTSLGARMVRMELVQNRLEQDEISYTHLTSTNEDTDLIAANIRRFSAEAVFMASLRANSGIIQMSLANFLR